MTEVMGGRRHISVLLALFGAAWLPYGDNYEKDGMRHLLRQMRPFDGGAYNGSDVDSALVSRPLSPGTSTHFHASARHGGRRMEDVSYVRESARLPQARESGSGRTLLGNFFAPGGPSRRANEDESRTLSRLARTRVGKGDRGRGMECTPPHRWRHTMADEWIKVSKCACACDQRSPQSAQEPQARLLAHS